MSSDMLRRVSTDPEIFGGKPIVRDMRISVELVLSLVAAGASFDEILEDYPGLEREDILACVEYARAVIANDTLDAVRVAGQ